MNLVLFLLRAEWEDNVMLLLIFNNS